MCDSSVFVGLDYHQASVQVCVEDRAGKVLLNRRCQNEWEAVVKAAESWARSPGQPSSPAAGQPI